MKPLRTAVIGVGYLGKFHAEKHKNLPHVELKAVCDPVAETGRAVAEKLGVVYESDFKKLIGQVDAVTIAATTRVHFEIGQFFLQNGIPVLMEKPLAATISEGQKLVDLAEQKRLVLAVGHLEQFNPAFEFFKMRVKVQEIQFLQMVRSGPFTGRGADVSVCLDLMIHDMELALSLFSNPMKKVRFQGTSVRSSTKDWGLLQVNCGEANLVFEAHRNAPVVDRSFRAVTKQGEWRVNLAQPSVQWTDGGESFSQTFEKSDALFLETQDFIAAIVEHREPRTPGARALKALEMIETFTEV